MQGTNCLHSAYLPLSAWYCLTKCPAQAAIISKAWLAKSVSEKSRFCIKWPYFQSDAWSTKSVMPQMHSVVRNPIICGTKPGCADTIWSVDMQSPGWSCSLEWIGLHLLPEIFHGHLCAWPNLQETQMGMLSCSFINRWGKTLRFANLIIWWNGMWYRRNVD